MKGNTCPSLITTTEVPLSKATAAPVQVLSGLQNRLYCIGCAGQLPGLKEHT